MDEGWTRWVFEKSWDAKDLIPSSISFGESLLREVDFDGVVDQELRDSIHPRSRVIIFPDQSPNQILNGYAKGSMPDEYTGGVGKEGVENLRKFVENGGTLVFLNRSSNFAIEQFNLPVKDVTRGLNRKDFYIPGSILRTELDLTHPIAKGMPQQSIAWFENSPVFELQAEPPALAGGGIVAASSPPAHAGGSASVAGARVIAAYPKDPKQILLSGWALGAEKIAGKSGARRIYDRQRQDHPLRLSPAIPRPELSDISAAVQCDKRKIATNFTNFTNFYLWMTGYFTKISRTGSSGLQCRLIASSALAFLRKFTRMH